MAIYNRASSALVLAGVLLAGCAEGNDGIFTTGSLTGATETKADPACVTLASRIQALRKDGIPDKIEKAAARRYRMTRADLGKADQLTKANAEFQARCSTVKTAPVGQGRQGAEEGGQGDKGALIGSRRSHTIDPAVASEGGGDWF
jgi:outer membrane murein-binding lipoprotein Lpp